MDDPNLPLYRTKNNNDIIIRLAVLDEVDREHLVRLDLEDEAELYDVTVEELSQQVEGSNLRATTSLVDLDEDEWEGEMYARALDLEWVPRWWAVTDGCLHLGECQCGPITLEEALVHLGQERRSGAVAAQLELLGSLAIHHEAAVTLSLGDITDDVCVGCLTDVEAHIEALDCALAEAGKELGLALRSGEVQVDLS